MASILYGASGKVDLLGNASELIEITHTNPVTVSWAPTDRRAMDVEVRVSLQQIPGLTAPTLAIGAPWVRWGVRTAHGASVIDEPQASFPLKPGTFDAFADIPRTMLSLMPGRGLHFRVNTRELGLVLQNTGYFGVGYRLRDVGLFGTPFGEYMEEIGLPQLRSFPHIIVAVSFQPCEGLTVPVLPRYASVVALETQTQWGNYVQVPAAASEWRVFNDHGMALSVDYDASDPDFAAKNDAAAIKCLDAAGKLIASILPWQIAEFSPLPLGIWAFCRPIPDDFSEFTQPFNVEFR